MGYFGGAYFKLLCIMFFITALGSFSLSVNAALININTASLEELDTLDGIGPAYAQRIIDYRFATPFQTIEEIKNVSGIGEATFLKIKDNITVGVVSQSNATPNNNTIGDISTIVLETSTSGLNLQREVDYKIVLEREGKEVFLVIK